MTLDGLLWVLGNGASWRDLPEEEFGPWETVYGRYRRRRREGHWQQVVESFGPTALTHEADKSDTVGLSDFKAILTPTTSDNNYYPLYKPSSIADNALLSHG